MILLTYEQAGSVAVGALIAPQQILPVEGFASLREILEAEEDGLPRVQKFLDQSEGLQLIDLQAVRLLAPLQPGSIRDCMAFEQHIIQATRRVVRQRSPLLANLDAIWRRWGGKPLIGVPGVWYDMPVYYTSNPRSVIGTNAEVRWPSYTQQLDFELEWAVVIGKRGRDIPGDKARDYIAGYTIFNDFSARDIQLREMQGRLGPAKGKNFDTGNAIGPWLVTPDELEDPYNLCMTARVNGETWSEGNTGTMFHRFEDIIAHISQDETLYPGDLIGSGTVGGGCGLELDRWLQVGDVVELEVEGLGVLRNTIGPR